MTEPTFPSEATSAAAKPLPTAVPAASLIVFRHNPVGGSPELLMVERAAHMRFAAGAVVFPGGRVDPADHALAADVAPTLDRDDAAARVAAVRETLEETGLVIGIAGRVDAEAAAHARALLLERSALGWVLAELGWELDLGRLVPFARWCPHRPKAFDTRFYIADVGTGSVNLAADGTESSQLFWSSAEATLRLVEQGAATAIFPTVRNLERLAQHHTFAEAAEAAGSMPITTIVPWVDERGGQQYLTIPEGLGYPTTMQRLEDVRRS